LFLRRGTTTTRRSTRSALLSITGLGALIYAIIEAPGRGWLSQTSLLSFLTAAVILAAFAGWELHTAQPMLDLRFFRNPRFTAATSTITLIFFVIFGTIFILTQYLQLVLGYDPLQAGLRVVPWAIAYMISAPLSARAVERWGQRLVVGGGLGIVATGLALLSRSGARADYPLLALALVVLAIGQGLATAPSTGAIVVSLPLDKAGVGSAINDTTREFGGALGVAVFGSVLASRYRADLAQHLSGLPAAAHAATGSLGATLQTAATLRGPDGATLAGLARLAYVHAFDQTITVTVLVAVFAAALVSWLLRPAPVAVKASEAVAYAAQAA